MYFTKEKKMDFIKIKIDWDKLQKIVEEKTGNWYSKGYLQGVRNGNHTNKTIQNIYNELGIKK